MKGLFPWIREALFGPSCAEELCGSRPYAGCGADLCSSHHRLCCCPSGAEEPKCRSHLSLEFVAARAAQRR